jgi:hypothetical protein
MPPPSTALMRFAERFRRVQVEQLDWRKCVERYDRPGAVLYLDPPYHPDTRCKDRHNAYQHDLDASDHEELVRRAKLVRASVLVSGYPHPLYDWALAAAGFERHEFAHNSTAAPAARQIHPTTRRTTMRSRPSATTRQPAAAISPASRQGTRTLNRRAGKGDDPQRSCPGREPIRRRR